MNLKSPSALRAIEVPDNIPNYEQTMQMSRRLDAYFIRKGIQWSYGRQAFLFGFKRKQKIP
jgi:hypothetical protein